MKLNMWPILFKTIGFDSGYTTWGANYAKKVL